MPHAQVPAQQPVPRRSPRHAAYRSVGSRPRGPARPAAHKLARGPTAVRANQRVQVVLQVAVAIAVDGLDGGAQRLNSVARVALCLVVNLHLVSARTMSHIRRMT